MREECFKRFKLVYVFAINTNMTLQKISLIDVITIPRAMKRNNEIKR